jgi:hypothetical protein
MGSVETMGLTSVNLSLSCLCGGNRTLSYLIRSDADVSVEVYTKSLVSQRHVQSRKKICWTRCTATFMDLTPIDA